MLGKVLGVSVRQIQKYLQPDNPPTPKKETIAKIRESFARHEKGQPLFEAENGQGNDLRDDLIKLLKEQNARLQKDLEFSLRELDQRTKVIAEVQNAIMEMLLVQAADRKGVYSKCVEILRKYKLEGSFL